MHWLKRLLLAAGPYTELELDAGHFLMRDQTEATLAAVMDHLGRADPARRSGMSR